MISENLDTTIETLGESTILSPLMKKRGGVSADAFFIRDSARILGNLMTDAGKPDNAANTVSFEAAGPRKNIFFDPANLRCAIVTCGGLCPGLNDIIRAIVLELYHNYGVKNIYGIRHGLEGFIETCGHPVMELTPDRVSGIQNKGGSILGSSRGSQDISLVVDFLERMNIGILFMVGGDGTLRASEKIVDEISARNMKTSVVGVPKTIDNDIVLVSRSFGFDTAVDIATLAIKAAHNEAEAYPNGIGLIRVMGRHSGFLAATAALAQQDANFVLIPEVHIPLDGEHGLLQAIEKRIALRKHAVILVAEGAGQNFFEKETPEFDPSGNIILRDIGIFLKERISQWFGKKNIPVALKYIDPSYMIRSLPANANDSVFCGLLARNAVHAGMAGKTKVLISYWNDHYIHVPMNASAGKRKTLDPCGRLWQSVVEATGQNDYLYP